MKCVVRRVCYLVLKTTVLSLLGLSSVAADEPTLARLSFWVPPERMAEFETAYRKQVLPILKRHGLEESPERGWATADRVFARLFQMKSASEVASKEETLRDDPAWQAVLKDLGTAFGTVTPDSLIRQRFGVYTTPAHPGRIVPAGPGKVVPAGPGTGQWHAYGMADGLPEGFVRAILQDGDGYMWFGTKRGVSRYDGYTFTSFTTEDGLAHNEVTSILQDREGNLWFGTWGGGVSRYDPAAGSGQAGWTSFTTEHGLAANEVSAIFQDRERNLWFGTGRPGLSDAGVPGKGVSRYDGRTFTIFTEEDGLAGNTVESIQQDQKGNLWFGTWGGGVSRYDGQTFTTFTTEHGLAHNEVRAIFQDRERNLWFATNGGVSRYDGQTFTTEHGLIHNQVFSIFQDREGDLWFGTRFGGVYRYDGQKFTHFTTEDGLVSKEMTVTFQDRDGVLWFGTLGGGVSRYDGKAFTRFTTEDGLRSNTVQWIFQDRERNLWFSTYGGGVSRYDGQTFTTFTREDGLVGNQVYSICQDREGNLWFGTWDGGVSRYDGKTFTNFTIEDGLEGNHVRSIIQDREGHLWFGTWGGASRYDGKTLTTFTAKDGLADGNSRSIFQDREGNLWFGAYYNSDGLTRYDGQAWTTFTTKDGLATNSVGSILQDRNGHLWFAGRGGVSRYDGQVFQRLTLRDGLAGRYVRHVFEDRRGNLWFSTTSGLTRFRPPPPAPPSVSIDAVVADRRYAGAAELSVPSSIGLAAFEFHGMSFKTRPEAMVYRYRLKDYDEGWKNTREHHVEYQDLPVGDYIFEVLAVDRDLVYSQTPATVHLTIHPPYERIVLISGLGLALLVAFVTTGYAVRKRHSQRLAERALMHELEEELQTAHDMQMGLMPSAPPRIEGFEITGHCLPANHVGGDFFQYFEQDGKLAVCMADVTGHAMEAAVPVMMFSGILKSQMEVGGSVEEIFGRLNRSLHGTLDKRTFICFTMGELDTATRSFHLANGGCPYPYHFRAVARDVVELQADAYPLGVRPDTTYPVLEVELGSGDRIVFCSDGIIEAENAEGEIFGFERTADAIRQGCMEDLSAEALIDRLIGAVKGFAGDVPPGDDMTVVVLKVEADPPPILWTPT